MKKLTTLAVLSIAIMASNANANSITYSVSSPTDATWSQLLTLPKFNLAGATLNGAVLTFSGTLTSAGGAVANGSNNPINTQVTASGNVSFIANGSNGSTNLGLGLTSTSLSQTLFSGTLPANSVSTYLADSQTGGNSAAIDNAFLSFLQGTNDISIFAQGNATLSATNGATIDSAASTLGSQLSVTYSYVPEPTTLVLLGIAMLGLGIRSKNKA